MKYNLFKELLCTLVGSHMFFRASPDGCFVKNTDDRGDTIHNCQYCGIEWEWETHSTSYWDWECRLGRQTFRIVYDEPTEYDLLGFVKYGPTIAGCTVRRYRFRNWKFVWDTEPRI